MPKYQITVSTRHAEVDDIELRFFEDDQLIRSIPLASFLEPGQPFRVSEITNYKHLAMDYAHKLWFHGAGDHDYWPMEDGVYRSGRHLVNATANRALTHREIYAYKEAGRASML